MQNGYLEMQEFRNTLGVLERREYSWEGGPICEVSYDFIPELFVPGDDLTNIRIGPYRLHMIERAGWKDTILYVRKDYPFWWVLIAWHKGNRLLDIAYRRSIITMAVWGLAEYNPAVIPHWRDIRILKRLENWRKGEQR